MKLSLNRKTERVIFFLTLLLVLITFPSGVSASSVDTSVDRLWGQTSEGTSVAISQAGWGSSRVVLLARSDHFADALSGVPLAYAFKNVPGINSPVPLLLTTPRGLSSETREEIERLGAQTVIILGGPGAVLPQVESQLWNTPGVTEVQRIWGENAPGTARDIFLRMKGYAEQSGTAKPDTAIIATQVNFQDALAVSSPAAANNMPILLSNLSSLPPETLEALSQGNIRRVIIVGGGAVVSQEVETELNTRGYPVISRLWGNTEYDTAIDIATTGNSLFNFTRPGALFIARGDFFTDALSGGTLASRMNPAPIVLTHPGGLSQVLTSYLVSNIANITKVYILGGPGAIFDNLKTEIEGLVQMPPPYSLSEVQAHLSSFFPPVNIPTFQETIAYSSSSMIQRNLYYLPEISLPSPQVIPQVQYNPAFSFTLDTHNHSF